MRMMLALIAAILSTLFPAAVAAQTYTVDSITPWSIGTVAAASSGTTVFLNSFGTISTISGAGKAVRGPTSAETISIRCVDAGSNLCSDANNKARIRIGRIAVNTGRGLTMLDLGAYNGTGTIGPGVNQTTSNVDVQMSGWTASNQVRTFRLNCYWPIAGDDSGLATGTALSQFFVYAAAYPTVPVIGLTGTITGNVVKALTLAKAADLRFGTVLTPASGSFQVSISNTDGSRATTPGSATGNLVPSTYGPASYVITGEPGASFSLTYPSTLTMIGPANLSATLVGTSASGSYAIPAGGTLNLVIGGSVPIASSTPTGSYSGTFNVTLAYN